MKYFLDDKMLEDNDISISLEKMPNTEIRCRINLFDMPTCIVTKSGEKLLWQNPHYHKYCSELYIVKEGKILIVISNNGKIDKKIINKGEISIIEPNLPHNVYMFKDSATCVLKYGDVKQNDWYPDESLDNICSKIDIQNI